jgi:hypothetical protein
MTYQDPKLPGPNLGQNPPRDRRMMDTDVGAGGLVAGAIGFVLIISFIVYEMSPRTTAFNDSPSSTVGQGSTSVNSPEVLSRNPTSTPPTVAPPIDSTVPAEKIAPPAPTEPRIDN